MICSFLPGCGHCRWCSTGKSILCDLGETILDGMLPDGTYRFHRSGEDLGGMRMLGTQAEKAAEALARSGGGLSQPLRRVADVPAALYPRAVVSRR